MRRALQDNGFITADGITGQNGPVGSNVIGINLGYDYCAEHEWGIQNLCKAFGIPGGPARRRDISSLVQNDLVGADTRTVTRVPTNGLNFFKDLNGYAYLLFNPSFGWWKVGNLTAERFDQMLDAYKNEELVTAWDRVSFGIRVKNDSPDSGAAMLGQIYEAFTKRDVMIFLGGRHNPFANNGLVLAIRSRMPAKALNQMKEADEDYLNLTEAAEKTGIKENLKAAGRRYFALSPRWVFGIKSRDGAIKTAHPVIFWLNPMEQDRNNCGWFTVEQLLEWIDGKGPIPKSQAM